MLDAYDVPTMPSLPRRSPAESPIAQALVGVCGRDARSVRHGGDRRRAGSIRRRRWAPTSTATTSSGSGRSCRSPQSARYTGPVAWHFAGPISVGVALLRAGARRRSRSTSAAPSIRAHIRAHRRRPSAKPCPASPQLVIIDEPFADDVFGRDSPITPDESVDLVSSAMAAVEPVATVGVHCCGDDRCFAAARRRTARRVAPGLERDRPARRSTSIASSPAGGWIAWGAVATGGPIGVTANRSWHRLASLWHDLVQRGCSPVTAA